MSMIVSDDDREEEAALMADPILIGMATEFEADVDLSEFYHDDGTPRSPFMGVANEEYRKRGGEHSRSLGGVGRALYRLVQAARTGSTDGPTPTHGG